MLVYSLANENSVKDISEGESKSENQSLNSKSKDS